MTSPVPLRVYHQHDSSGDYTDSIIGAPERSTQLYGEGEYDPYSDVPGKPWSNTAFAQSVTDGMHKPSLSYDSKDLGK